MTPEGLVSKSTSTRQYVDEPSRWTEVVSKQPDRIVEFNLEKKVKDVQMKTEPLAYSLPNSLSRPDFPKLSPRNDPELFAPIILIARAVVGPLASYPDPRAGEYHDPLYPMKSEEDLRKEREKGCWRNRKKKKAASESPGGEGPGMEGGMPGGPGGGRQKGKKTRGARRGRRLCGIGNRILADRPECPAGPGAAAAMARAMAA